MIAITALLPLTAGLVVLQVNPYHALVIRGILGAIAALIYALFGAADVALTEALVGTMLSITLYAVAVRSSMSLRLGILEGALTSDLEPEHPAMQLLSNLRQVLSNHHMRLEPITYPSQSDLKAALIAKEIHAVYGDDHSLQTRLHPIYDIFRAELPPETSLSYFDSSHPEMPTLP
ncbi:MAG: DUF4040 domain-containing protein [Phormidesmis sp.]